MFFTDSAVRSGHTILVESLSILSSTIVVLVSVTFPVFVTRYEYVIVSFIVSELLLSTSTIGPASFSRKVLAVRTTFTLAVSVSVTATVVVPESVVISAEPVALPRFVTNPASISAWVSK